MRRTLVLVALLVPVASLAASPDWGLHGLGGVDIAGPVEVPLYRGPDTQQLPAVLVTVPAAKPDGVPSQWFAIVDAASGFTTVGSAVVGELGLKTSHANIQSMGGKVEVVTIPALHVGDVVLKDVKAVVKGDPNGITLGFGTFDQLAVAILPSTGKVKIAPAANAAALLAEVGPAVPATRIPAEKWFEYGQKTWGNGLKMSVPGVLLGKDGQVRVMTQAPQTGVNTGYVPMTSPTRKAAGMPMTAFEPVLGGAKLPATYVRMQDGYVAPDEQHIGGVGYDALYAADIAVAPSLDQIAIKAATAVKAEDPAPLILEHAKAVYEAATKAPPPATGDKTGDKAGDKTGGDDGQPAVWGPEMAYGDALTAAGHYAEAIEHYKKSVAVAGDHCEPYISLGDALLKSGDPQGAVEPLTKAGQLWDKWYSQPFDTRMELGLGKKVDGDVFTISQNPACATAWSELAGAELALGQHQAVAELYQARHVDPLDKNLPYAYGLSLALDGKPADANGPLRRAIEMGGQADAEIRSAVGLAAAEAKNPEVVDAQFDAVAHVAAPPELTTAFSAVEAARRVGGDAAALAAAKRLVDGDPLSVPAHLVYAAELTRQKSADAQAAVDALGPMLDAYEARNVHSTEANSYRALGLALKGDVEGAKAKLAANDGHARHVDDWVAAAMVALVQGDSAGAESALADLRTHSPLNPAILVDVTN